MSFSEGQTKISLRVYPNAARNGVVGFTDGMLRVNVAAAPIRGKANRELIAFLGQKLGVGRGSLTIIKGHTSRNKVIAIDGLAQAEVIRRLLPG